MPLGSFSLGLGDIAATVKIDSSAISALNLLPEGVKGAGSKTSSLFGVLNHTITNKLGERLLNQWIRQPLVSIEEIQARQSLVKIFCNDHDLRTSIREGPLKYTPDLLTLSKKMEKRKYFKLEDLYVLYRYGRLIFYVLFWKINASTQLFLIILWRNQHTDYYHVYTSTSMNP
jgi:DNA mismatch repair protein MSH2